MDTLIVGAIGAVCVVLLVRHVVRVLAGGPPSRECSCCAETQNCGDALSGLARKHQNHARPKVPGGEQGQHHA